MKGWIPMPNLPETMNQDIARKLLNVGEAFKIPGPFFSYEEIKMGNVNHTYKVNYIRDDGSGMAKIKSYLVQRVNTYAFQRPLELMSNIDKVTEYIHSNFPILAQRAKQIAEQLPPNVKAKIISILELKNTFENQRRAQDK